MLTEFGGINYSSEPYQPRFGYGTQDDPASYLAAYDALVSAVVDSPALAGFCYTQLTDTLQETNGLLTAEREPKVDLDAILAINTRPSKAIPGEAVHAAQRKIEILAPTEPLV
jgi:hypothetical protein